jgi:hypothetical protein
MNVASLLVAALGALLAALALVIGQWLEHLGMSQTASGSGFVSAPTHTALVLLPAAVATATSYLLFAWAYPAVPGTHPIAKAALFSVPLFLVLQPAALRELPVNAALYPAWVVAAQCAVWWLFVGLVSLLFSLHISRHDAHGRRSAGAA